MTITIIRSQHSSYVNFIIALFSLICKIALSPFAVFRSQLIIKENLMDHFYTGNKACRVINIFFPGIFCLTIPVTGEFKYVKTWK